MFSDKTLVSEQTHLTNNGLLIERRRQLGRRDLAIFRHIAIEVTQSFNQLVIHVLEWLDAVTPAADRYQIVFGAYFS